MNTRFRHSIHIADVLPIHIGFLSLVQMSRIKLFKGYYLGTGLITVVGTSFSTLSTADAVCNLLREVSGLPNQYSVPRSLTLCIMTGHVHQ